MEISLLKYSFNFFLLSAQLRQFADHASKSIFPNAFKVISLQTEYEREEGVVGLSEGLTGLVEKMGSISPYFEGDNAGMKILQNFK